MADEPKAKPKGKGGNLLKKKVAGIPVPVLLIVAGVGGFYLWKKYKGNQSASTSLTATPTASSTAPADTSGGYTSGQGYGGYGGYDPTASSVNSTPTDSSPTDTSSLTPAPVSTNAARGITPIGSKTITIGGKAFNTVSGFTLANGNTYLGVNNPTEAKALEAKGVSLVHNPNDPNTSSLFVLIPKGKTAPTIKAAAKKPAPKKKVAAKK